MVELNKNNIIIIAAVILILIAFAAFGSNTTVQIIMLLVALLALLYTRRSTMYFARANKAYTAKKGDYIQLYNKAVRAGLDLEMPGPAPHNAEEVRKAVENGTLAMAELDECVSRLVSFILRAVKVRQRPYSIPLHHEIARKAAASSLVLLEKHSALPISNDGKYAVIGSLAEHIRYQGAGSSKINPHKVDNILSSLDKDIHLGISFLIIIIQLKTVGP